MYCNELFKYLENWAPKGTAFKNDNTGLQIGDTKQKINKILLSLDFDEKVLDEAISTSSNLIITHHPFIFNPIKKIDASGDKTSALIKLLIKNDIVLYAMHTNADFTKGGVSFKLAERLGLNDIRFLENIEDSRYKISVFIPEEHIDSLAKAVFNAGAGVIGEYSMCSYRSEGIGTFRGSENTNPQIGEKLKLEKIKEIKLEFLVDSWNLQKVISEMIKNHPYEEPAYDINVLKNKNENFGYGAIGKLEKEIDSQSFLDICSEKLNLVNFRYAYENKKRIQKVAVCGGSGSDLIDLAIKKGADAFVTADIKYHAFQDAGSEILLIDPGHNETEIIIMDVIKEKTKEYNNQIIVEVFSDSTNKVKYYKI